MLFLTVLDGWAQQTVDITGIVREAGNSSPLTGATVVIQGTTNGTATNAEGKFRLEVSNQDLSEQKLVVSFIGYEPQTVKLGNKTNFEILLDENVNALDEVVVTSSYGTKKLKQEVVGSISSIKTEDLITEQSAVSFDELLEGQTAGVYVESNAELGKPVNIHVRGQGSLTPLNNNAVGSSTQPLIIVDGVILAEEINLDGNNFFDGGTTALSEDMMNPLAKIGIKDIQSINVLKDAAAVSLYGADGANGVIIITTKGGHKGPLKFNASVQTGISTAMNRTKYMNGEQYQEIKNRYYRNSGQPENIAQWNRVSTDWYDLLNRTGVFQDYNLSASGGSDLLKVRLALGYRKIQEPQINNNFAKYNTNIALDFVKDKFRVSLKTQPSLTVKNSPNTLYSYPLPPTIPAYDSTGNYTRFNNYGNPLAVANQNRALVETKALINSLTLNYQFSESLSISSLYGLDFSNKDQDTYFSGLNDTGIDNNGNIGRRILRDRNTRRWNWNARLQYNKSFAKKHTFDALAGIETRGNSIYFSYAKGENFTEPGKILPIEQAEDQDYEEDKSESTGRSFFSQLNYDFSKKYYLLANFRIDQSSVFGTDNNTSFNGGLGASWVISKENFLSGTEWIDFLRLRLSYGTSGNSRIGSYRAMGLYVFDDEGGDGYNGGNTAEPYTAPNPYLGWEKNYKFNAGADVNTGWLSTTVEFFHDDIRDMIVSRSVVPETGYPNVQINGANMYNRGIEVSFRAKVINTSSFKWTSNFNFSRIENKVTYLEGLGSDYSAAERARAQKVGYPTTIIWGYNYIGVDPATGRELYNVDGNIIDANYLKDHYNTKEFWVPIGNTQPDFFGGLNNQFKIGRNIDVAMVMSYSYGSEIKIDKQFLDNYNGINYKNMSVNTYYDSWKKPGDIALYAPPVKSNPLISNTTKYIYSNTHVKLKSINVSYRIPVNNKNLPFDVLRFYANASNLWQWFAHKGSNGSNGVAELRNSYPEMRTFSLGINANF